MFEFSSRSSLNYPSNTTSITVLLTSSKIFEQNSNTNARTQVHMCGGYENIIVVDEGPTNETETPVDILTDYRIDYSLENFKPADHCCACLGLPFVYVVFIIFLAHDTYLCSSAKREFTFRNI